MTQEQGCSTEDKSNKEWLKLGHIAGVFGIKGWLKIYSNTDDKAGILSYKPWYIERNNVRQLVNIKAGKPHGKTVIAQLEGVNDRNEAELWVGCDIYIKANQLVKLGDNEFYWSDLMGLNVISVEGEDFGVIASMLETGANDVMVIKGERERLIPFSLNQVIKSVDLVNGKMVVDWDPDF